MISKLTKKYNNSHFAYFHIFPMHCMMQFTFFNFIIISTKKWENKCNKKLKNKAVQFEISYYSYHRHILTVNRNILFLFEVILVETIL